MNDKVAMPDRPPAPPACGFQSDLAEVINRHSKENGSNTPDIVLARFLAMSLEAWEACVVAREVWYGRKPVLAGFPKLNPVPEEPTQEPPPLPDDDCLLQLSTPSGVTHKLQVPQMTAAAVIRAHADLHKAGASHAALHKVGASHAALHKVGASHVFIMPGCYSIDLASYSLVAASPVPTT